MFYFLGYCYAHLFFLVVNQDTLLAAKPKAVPGNYLLAHNTRPFRLGVFPAVILPEVDVALCLPANITVFPCRMAEGIEGIVTDNALHISHSPKSKNLCLAIISSGALSPQFLHVFIFIPDLFFK
jgi:hypothetical protein